MGLYCRVRIRVLDSAVSNLVFLELIYEIAPYTGVELGMREILDRIKGYTNVKAFINTSLLRPKSDYVTAEQVHGEERHLGNAEKFRQLMTNCWHETVSQRPQSFTEIRKIIKQMNEGKNLNILDSLLNKLEG